MAQTAILSLRMQTSAAMLASQNGIFLGADAALSRPAGSIRQRYVPVTACAGKKNHYIVADTTKAATFSLVAAALMPAPAVAVDTEAVTSVLSQVEDLSAQLSKKASITYETARGILEQVLTVTKPAIDAATPVIKDAAVKAYELAAPVASKGFERAQIALSEAGVDTTPIVQAAKTVVEVASGVTQQTQGVFTQVTPGASSTLQNVLSLDPTILAAGSGALFLLYLLAPSLGSAVAYSARGYAGELTAAQTLDLLSTSGYTLVDVRSEREKAKSGLPSLPRNAKKKVFAIGVEELPSRLRGQIRNSQRVEAELAAIKISSLKRINKSSSIAIIDSYGPIAKNVAKSLTKFGFKRAYVVKDGIDGGSGWLNSQLATDPYYSSDSQILNPSRVIPASGTRRGTGDVVDVQPSRRGFLLPRGSDE